MINITETRSALAYTLPLRLFLAYEWLDGGIEKIQSIVSNPKAAAGFAAVFGNWAKGNPYPFMTDFLKAFAVPNAAAIFTVVAAAETLVGVAFLLGFLIRPASIGGVILNSFFYLAAGFSSTSTAGVNLVMIGAQLSTLLLSPGRVLGIDALLHKRLPQIPLW
jgi:uncharacterized membrane protein YphA (DoxX/SURF4 family)